MMNPNILNQNPLMFFDRAVNAKEREAAKDIEEALIKHIQKQARHDGVTSD